MSDEQWRRDSGPKRQYKLTQPLIELEVELARLKRRKPS
jgi:hypothetical protein